MALDQVAGKQPVMLSVSGSRNSDVDAVNLKRRRRIATSECCRHRTDSLMTWFTSLCDATLPKGAAAISSRCHMLSLIDPD
jgi:hypothetical protein